MNKKFSLLLTLIMLAFGIVLLNCGSDSHPSNVQPPPPTQTADFAFMQGITDTYVFTPMLGKFTVSGGNEQFTATPIKDPSNGQPVEAQFYSITLGRDGKKAAIDLWGGLDGTSNQWDIWVGNVADASMVQISNDAYSDLGPQLSPDGTKVVYVSFRENQWPIVIRNANGTGGEQVIGLPEGFSYWFAPTYSPDGGKIAIGANGVMWDGNKFVEFQGIWTMNADGTNLQMLTNVLANCSLCEDRTPAFSADGSTIAFSRIDYGTMTEDIYVMSSDGSNVGKVTDGVGVNSDPMFVWTGNKEKLLLSSNRDHLDWPFAGAFELYSMNTDGTGLVRLTDNVLFDAFCGWWFEIGLNPARQPFDQRGPYQQHHSGLRW